MSSKGKIEIPPTVLDRPKKFWDRGVGVDCDQVIVDFNGRVSEYVSARRARFGGKPVDVTKSRTYYYFADPRVGLGENEEGEALKELYLATQGGMGELKFYDTARQAIREIASHCIQPYIITSVPNALEASGASEQRYGWGTAQDLRIRQFFDAGLIRDSQDVIFCSAAEKPRFMLKGVYHIPLLVDDRPSTLVSARWDYGLIAVGIRSKQTLYNQGQFEGITWFESLADAVPSILEVYEELERRELLGRSAHMKGSDCQ